jgi:hypothetical protein
MEVSGQLHAPAALLPERRLRYPLNRRVGGPQSRSRRCGEEQNSLPLSGIHPRSSVPVALSLHWLSYGGSCTRPIGTEIKFVRSIDKEWKFVKHFGIVLLIRTMRVLGSNLYINPCCHDISSGFSRECHVLCVVYPFYPVFTLHAASHTVW